MRKFNWLDAVIILIVLAIGFCGFKYLQNKTTVAQTADTKKLYFMFEIPQAAEEVAENIAVDTDIVFGEKKVSKGKIVSKIIEPFKDEVPNLNEGYYEYQEIPNKHRVVLRIEFDGVETENAFTADGDQLNVGLATIVSGVGINSTGTIVDIGGAE